MSTVQTRYVTWISRGRRNHGSASLDLVPPLTTQASNPGTYQAWASPDISWQDAKGQTQTAHFAFWSVVGGSDGAAVVFNPSLSVQIGPQNVQATAWYLPGGGGGGSPGTFVDAFDVNLGNFVDDDFVAISPDAGLSASANETGFVPSESAEQIDAYGSIHTVPFDDWRILVQTPPGSHSASGTEQHAAANSSGVAFAFYRSPSGGGMHLPDAGRYQLGTWVSWGVMVDGGGPTGDGPVDPWGPLVRSLGAAMAMADAAKLADPELQRAGLDLAAKQLEMTAGRMADAMRKYSVPGAIAAPVKR